MARTMVLSDGIRNIRRGINIANESILIPDTALGNLTNVVDGNTATYAYGATSGNATLLHRRFGQFFNVHLIKYWHFYGAPSVAWTNQKLKFLRMGYCGTLFSPKTNTNGHHKA